MIHYIEEKQLTNEVLKANQLLLAEFCISNSELCDTQNLILHEIEKKYQNDIQVFKIIDAEIQELNLKYQINSFPTILFFKEAKEVTRQVGLASEEKLNGFIQELL